MSENINRLNDALLQVNSAYKQAVEDGNAEEASRLAGQINTLGTEITRLRAVKDPAAMAAEADEMANATARDVVKAFPSSVIRGGAAAMDLGRNVLDLAQGGPLALAGRLSGYGAQAIQEGALPPIDYKEAVRPAMADVTGGFSEYQPQTLPGQIASTTGEFMGGAAVMPFGGMRQAVTSTIAPALASEAAGQATKGTEYEGPARLLAALGTPAASTVLQRGAQRAALGPDARINVPGSARGQSVSLLEQAGVPMTTGLKTGSDKLRAVEGSLEVPLETKTGLTQAVMRMAGSDKPLATGPALDEIGNRLGTVFDRAESVAGDVPAESLGASALKVLDDHKEFAGDDVIPQALTKIANKIAGAAETGAELSGRTLQDMRKKLRKVMEGKGQDSNVTFEAALRLNNLIDDFMIESVRAKAPKMVPELMEARQQYRTFLTLMNAMKRSPGSDSASGLISPQMLSGALRRREGDSYIRGTGSDLASLARAAEEVVSSASTVKAGGVRTIDLPRGSAGPGSTIGALLGGSAGLYGQLDPYMIGLLGAGAGAVGAGVTRGAPAVVRAAQRSKAGQQYLMPTGDSAATQMLLDTLRSGARQTGGLLNIPQ
jgi:hypothetical protein